MFTVVKWISVLKDEKWVVFFCAISLDRMMQNALFCSVIRSAIMRDKPLWFKAAGLT